MEEPKKPKRQVKTPYQLEILEIAYALEPCPSEATRSELWEKLRLTDDQLRLWFCHRRLEEELGVKMPRAAGRVGKGGSDHGSMSWSGPGSGFGSRQSDYRHDVPTARAIKRVEAQLEEPLREDGPIIGMEFDELPAGAFGVPTAAQILKKFPIAYIKN